MTDPVSVSALLIGAGVAVITQILTLIDTAISRNANSSCKKALSALKGTITSIQPILKKRRDKDSAVDDWFKKLAAYLNIASWLVEQTKPNTQNKKLITTLTKDIENHLRLSSLVNIVQNEEILEKQRQINEALACFSPVAYTAKASSQLSPDRTPSYESTLELLYFTPHGVEEEDRTENPRIGRVLYDYDAVCYDEVNLTAGEEVQIIFEEEGRFYVLKNPGRNSEMIEGFAPMIFVNSS